MPTIAELKTKYNQLSSLTTSIPNQIQKLLTEIDTLTSQQYALTKKIQDWDLKISEMPTAVYSEQCGGGFFGMGKSCQDVPSPNPDVANGIAQKNDIVRQRNTVQDKINAKYQQIATLATQDTDAEQQIVDIRGQIISAEQAILDQPENAGDIINLLLGRHQPLNVLPIPVTEKSKLNATKQKLMLQLSSLQKILPANLQKYAPYLAIIAVAGAIVILTGGKKDVVLKPA